MQDKIRQLAAIMFTDMVGYTALMQADEIKAKKLRDRHRSILEKRIQEYHGLILQYYGDGSLSVFGSAIEAVECAVKIQLEMQEDPVIPSRIGLNVGDIVYDDDGVYGDGVNIASRIESMSVSGAVLLSEKVYDEIKNHPEFPAVNLGNFQLKNVKRPIDVYAIKMAGLVMPKKSDLKGKAESVRKSIAVLPFVNMSSNAENEYFSDGITEEIINALTKLEGLQVTSRTSAFAFKDQNVDVREIGNRLNVGTILEGSVRQAGNRIRITSQLINTSDGYHIWSETYDRNLEDIFEIQDEISIKITNKLREKLTFKDQKKSLVKAPTENLEAYNAHLKGQFHWNKWNPADAYKAIEYFNLAIKLEPGFALPYTGLSSCYSFLGAIGLMSSHDAYPKAHDYALKSLKLDPMLAESHLALAMVNYFYNWDWAGAEKSFKKAFELNPGLSDTHRYYSMFLSTIGQPEKALEEAQIAYASDPLSTPTNHILAGAHVQMGQYERAIEIYKHALEFEKDSRLTFSGLGWTYLRTGNFDDALSCFNKASNISPDDPQILTSLIYLYIEMDKKDKATELFNKFKKIEESNPNASLEVDKAVIYLGFGDYDSAFENLDKAIEKKSGGMVFINHAYWRKIHKDKRFKQLLVKMNLPYKG